MFRGISENPPQLPGKRTGAATVEGKASHFTLGEDTLEGAKTSTQQAFAGFGGQKLERTRPVPKPVSQIVMGDTPVSYMSNAKSAFNGPPKNF